MEKQNSVSLFFFFIILKKINLNAYHLLKATTNITEVSKGGLSAKAFDKVRMIVNPFFKFSLKDMYVFIIMVGSSYLISYRLFPKDRRSSRGFCKKKKKKCCVCELKVC